MKKFLIIIIACFFCIGCGVKSDPEYKTQSKPIKVLQKV